MEPITVIHHSADYDGIFCREIARKFLPDAELIGWDFGDEPLKIPEGQIYILDLPVDRVFGFDFQRMGAGKDSTLDGHISISQPDSGIRGFLTAVKRVVWIDHHKSSIETHPSGILGYRIDGVAACRLAWQWFTQNHNGPAGLPEKASFLDRVVIEPLAVRLAGEYDVWDHRDNDADVAFQFGLDAQENLQWEWLLGVDESKEFSGYRPSNYCSNLINDGLAAMRCYAKRDADIMRTRSFVTVFEGLKFLCLNTARCNSNTFAAKDIPETGHDGLLAFYWAGGNWSVSMYHAAHRKDLDLSQIAVKYGGGGHRGACGFRAKTLPFLS